MTVRALWIIAVVGCDTSSAPASPDAAHTTPPGPCIAMAGVTATCRSGRASVFASRSDLSPHGCSEILGQSAVDCTAGCMIEGSIAFGETEPEFQELMRFRNNAEVMCTETPAAQVGDPCTTNLCLPTRATLAADGTVESQTYLGCDGTQCGPRLAPAITNYLQPCNSALVAQYGTANAVGTFTSFNDVCLIAWDDATQSAASGMSRPCMGDWMCPSGSLCDDQIPALGMSSPTPVCKPGPRGMLAPSMLSR